MKHLDLQMVLFVGVSLIHDYWLYWGLPRAYYFDVKREHLKKSNEENDDDDKVA